MCDPCCQCPSVDLETLLGNVEEVVEVSQKLLTQLEGATSGRDFDKQIIGKCEPDIDILTC